MQAPKRKSVVLMQGVFDEAILKGLSANHLKDIFILEGRPNLEASKTSAKAFQRARMTPTVIADNMAGFLFYRNLVREVWLAYQYEDPTGALCDSGALILGVLGKKHKVPVKLFPGKIKSKFMADQEDITSFLNKPITAKGVKGYAPLVEWLPRKYITKVY